MAAAEASDLSDASDETVEQQHGSEHDTDESDVDDGGAADQPAVVITRHACGGEDTLTVVSVALAQSRGGKAADKRQKYGAWCNVSANPEHTQKHYHHPNHTAYLSRTPKIDTATRTFAAVFLRELEWHCDKTAGRSTSRLSKKLTSMGVADAMRVVEAKHVRDGEITQEEWSQLLTAYMDMQRARDPLVTTGMLQFCTA